MVQDELIPLLAKNQFKSKLNKYISKTKEEKKFTFNKSFNSKIDAIMNPSKKVNKDNIKVLCYVNKDPHSYFM